MDQSLEVFSKGLTVDTMVVREITDGLVCPFSLGQVTGDDMKEDVDLIESALSNPLRRRTLVDQTTEKPDRLDFLSVLLAGQAERHLGLCPCFQGRFRYQRKR